ncbi:hypothetical protein [Leptospira santarosai]|uniref:hypothetical protein n=2 Tax=Leptospira TaxID=171 RepID=UPI00063BC983|nr:hypothetical protein [Leptospira santarosai]AVV51473.1 Uncharacterized protein XB17_02896 [Leptospira santarosai]
MDKTQIESIGISYFKIFLRNSKILRPDTNENDKTPSWDGDIFVYKQPNHNSKKEHLRGRVPIQVKSSEHDSLAKESISLDKSDLNNYLNDGGIILVRPIYFNETYKIFGRILLPLNIKKYFSTAKKDSETISIRLKEFDRVESFEKECLFFLENQPLQMNQNNFISLDKVDLTQGTFFAKSIWKENIFKAALSEDSHLYFKLNYADITVPVEAKLSEIGFEKEIELKINDKVYFNKAFFGERTDGRRTIRLNNCLVIDFDEIDINILFKSEHAINFEETLSALRFLRDLEFTKSFLLGDLPFKFSSYNATDDINKQLNLFEDTWEAFSFLK